MHNELIERLNGAKQRYFDDAVLKQLIVDCKAALTSPEAPSSQQHYRDKMARQEFVDLITKLIVKYESLDFITDGKKTYINRNDAYTMVWCTLNDYREFIASIPTAEAPVDHIGDATEMVSDNAGLIAEIETALKLTIYNHSWESLEQGKIMQDCLRKCKAALADKKTGGM